MKNKVLLIYTGGTIGMGCNPQTGALEPLDFHHLKEKVYEFAFIKTGIDVYQFNTPIDSSDMDHRMWAKLVQIIAERYDDYDGFVILHGTDTMAYTASALSYMLENLTKPVILTGSQLPIGLTDVPECQRFASTSTAVCSAETVVPNRTLKDSQPSSRSTIRIFVMQASISRIILTIFSSPTMTGR